MPIEAVVFDLDDTLIFEEEVARASFRAIAEQIGAGPAAGEALRERVRECWRAGPYWPMCMDLGISSWEGLWSDFSGCHPTLDELRRWIPHYRRTAWRRALDALAVEAMDPEAIAGDYVRLQSNGHGLRPGAAPILEALRPRHPIGLLTNGPPDIQRLKVEKNALAGYFESIAISGEIGAGKPDAAAFGHVLKELDVVPEAAVMIGDSWERDVIGADTTGMRAIWVSNGRPVPEHRPQVTVIDSVASLLGHPLLFA